MLVAVELSLARFKLAEPSELTTLPLISLISAVWMGVREAGIESPTSGMEDIPETVI